MSGRVFAPDCPAAVGRKLQTVQASAPPSLKKIEPTVYVVSSTSSPKAERVRIGNPHCCTCQKKQPCTHVLAVLLFGLHVEPTNTLIWQQGLTELETSNILENLHNATELRCRFCKEQLSAAEGCADCGCQFHHKCLEMSARAKQEVPVCPACKSGHLSAPPTPTCSACEAPLTSPFYDCAICSHYTLCRRCYESKVHVEHPLRHCIAAPTTRGDPVITETPQSLMTRELNPEDYATLLSLDDSNQKSVLTEHQYMTLRHPLWGRDDGEEKCPICLLPFRFKERCVCLPCGHVFHDTCGKEWLTKGKDVCPIDKSKVHLPG